MAQTYEPIATTTLTTTTASVTFSSISSNYTDLVLVVNSGTQSGQDIFLRFNGDTGSNYSMTWLYANGTLSGSTRSANNDKSYLDYYGGTSTTVGNTVQIVNIMNYSNTTTFKTFLSRANNAAGGLDAVVNLWRSTNAITSILLYPANSISWLSGSTFTLYGITAA